MKIKVKLKSLLTIENLIKAFSLKSFVCLIFHKQHVVRNWTNEKSRKMRQTSENIRKSLK